MKRIVATSIALAAGVFATSVGAFTIGPPQIKSRLKGNVTFLPADGPSFTCKVVMVMKTRAGVPSGKDQAKIISAIVSGGGQCPPDVSFERLPWVVVALSAKGGRVYGGTWAYPDNSCTAIYTDFSLNGAGSMRVTGPTCIEGRLSSTPPIDITR